LCLIVDVLIPVTSLWATL